MNAHPVYNRTHFPHFVCNNGNWDICASDSGYCAAIPTPRAARDGCKASHFGDAAYVRATLGVVVMVPQQVQQQQANAAPLYAFQVRGEDARPVAPRTAQDVEGITPRSVVAQTVHVRTRADWYAFSRACRTVARNRVEARKAGESIFWAMIGGRVHRLSVERTSFGAVRTVAGAYRRVCHGAPVALATARLTQRPRRALIAAELDWAAKYRGNAMRDARDRNAHRRALSVKAVRACIAEARGLWSAFDRLPG
jgi:hypothetical protein